MALHAALSANECHEPKQIIGALAADAGKVITPSVVAGVGELRFLTIPEVSGLTASLGAIDADINAAEAATAALTTTVNGKLGIAPRLLFLTSAPTLSVNVDNFDVLACDTLIENTTISAPTGTPANGQRLTVRIHQNSGGGHTITYNSIFVTTGANVTTASTTTMREFVYSAFRGKWIQLAFTSGI